MNTTKLFFSWDFSNSLLPFLCLPAALRPPLLHDYPNTRFSPFQALLTLSLLRL